MCTIKPDIRDILWAYERDSDLGKTVNNMGEILEHFWNVAIEDAAKIVEKYEISDPMIAYDIRGLRIK